MDRLNILVLHRLGNPGVAPFFLQRHVYALRNCFPDHTYIYHDVSLRLPGYMRDIEFDAIVLDVTLLGARWGPRPLFESIKSDYEFVKHANAVKLAFPQDDYDHHIDLDDWMCDWNVDVVFSVISSHWDVLYPRFHKRGDIRLGYTGYIDETLIDRRSRPFEERPIDIGYRAAKLPPYFGLVGETKWTIGRDVAAKARVFGLKTDIVLGGAGKLTGTSWLDFIESCKFTLGSNSGSSLLDPHGALRQRVKQYLRRSPEADFATIAQACFQGQDGHLEFTAISPRVMEAAMLESCQILVEGEYSGLIKPFEHYIPIAANAADFSDVHKAMSDRTLVQRLIANCRAQILDAKQLRYRNHAASILTLIIEIAGNKNVRSNSQQVIDAADRYRREMSGRESRYWMGQLVRSKVVDAVNKMPGVARLARVGRDRLLGR